MRKSVVTLIVIATILTPHAFAGEKKADVLDLHANENAAIKVQVFLECMPPTAAIELARLQIESGLISEHVMVDMVGKARKCLDENLAGAIEQTNGSGDFREAIKNYYVKAMAHLSSISDSRMAEKMAGRAQDESLQKVRLEAKLAGKYLGP